MFRFESFGKTILFAFSGLTMVAIATGCQGSPQAKNLATAGKPSGSVDLGTSGVKGGSNVNGASEGAAKVGASGGGASAASKAASLSAPNESAPLQIEKHNSKRLLKLQKSALKKEFLMSMAAKTSGATPNWFYQAPRIIYFEQQGEKLLVRQSNDTAIYSVIRQDSLLESFQIIQQNEQAIIFDLGTGFNSFFYSPARDIMKLRSNGRLIADRISHATVTSLAQTADFVEMDVTGKIQETENIQRDVNDKDMQFVRNFESTITMNYRLRPYKTNTSFEVRPVDSTQRVILLSGFRTVPAYENKIEFIMSRWDFSKGPVQVGIVKGFPEEFESGVVDSVAYWNRLYGAQNLKIVRGVDPQRPPPERMILIRWLPYEDATSAWANLQVDPRTGEIYNSQISITSRWKNPTNDFLVEKKEEGGIASPTLGFQSAKVCEMKISRPQFESIPVSRRKEISKDIVRLVIAHELGHSLGLAHNYSGSYNSQVEPKDQIEKQDRYLKGLSIDGYVPTTSVMDYSDPVEDGIIGQLITTGELPYDRAAVRFIESGNSAELSILTRPACGDALLQIATFKPYGCQKFDSSRNPILSAVIQASDLKNKIIQKLFEEVVDRLYPANSQIVLPIDEKLNEFDATFFKSFVFNSVFGNLDNVYPYFMYNPQAQEHDELKTNTLLYSVLQKNDWRQPDFKVKKTTEVLGGDLVEAGGVEKILKLVSPFFVSQSGQFFDILDDQILGLYSSPSFQAGVTKSGRTYTLTTSQQEALKTFFQLKKMAIRKEMWKFLVAWTPAKNRVYNRVLKNDAWYLPVISYVSQLLLASTGKEIQLQLGPKKISLKERAIPTDVRKELADFMMPAWMGVSEDVGIKEIALFVDGRKQELKELFTAIYEFEQPGKKKAAPDGVGDMKREIERLKTERKISNEVAVWMQNEIVVLDELLPY